MGLFKVDVELTREQEASLRRDREQPPSAEKQALLDHTAAEHKAKNDQEAAWRAKCESQAAQIAQSPDFDARFYEALRRLGGTRPALMVLEAMGLSRDVSVLIPFTRISRVRGIRVAPGNRVCLR